MELLEQRANELKASTVSITDKPAWIVSGTINAGLGTCVGKRLILTTKHIGLMVKPVWVWQPNDERRRMFKAYPLWVDQENCLLQTSEDLPYKPLPLPDSKVTKFLYPGATVLYPDGYATYDVQNPDNMLIDIGHFNGREKNGSKRLILQGRIGHGTSGGGVYSMEEGILVGSIYGFTGKYANESTQHTGYPNTMVAYATDSYNKHVTDHTQPSPAQAAIDEAQGAIAPIKESAFNLWKDYKVAIITGVAGLLTTVILMEVNQ